MSPEVGIEKQKTREIKLSEETKKVILEFINDRYPEKECILPTFKEIREKALELLSLLGTAEEDYLADLELQEIWKLLGAYLTHLRAQNNAELAEKIVRFTENYKILGEYVKEKLEL
mgnify:CR=1 FL=1